MSAELQTPPRADRPPRCYRCVPSGGKYPGEEHEALVSWAEHGKQWVSLRHLITGECSIVPIREVKPL